MIAIPGEERAIGRGRYAVTKVDVSDDSGGRAVVYFVDDWLTGKYCDITSAGELTDAEILAKAGRAIA